MSEPLSSQTAYASVEDLLLRYDSRTIGQLVSDMNTPVAADKLKANDTVLAALMDASGSLESACVAGNRYLPSDLQNLTGASQGFLKMLTCDLAMGRLVLRRPTKDGIPDFYQQALQWL